MSRISDYRAAIETLLDELEAAARQHQHRDCRYILDDIAAATVALKQVLPDVDPMVHAVANEEFGAWMRLRRAKE